jgi:hypothetical protein
MTAPLAYVSDGKQAIGFVLKRGKLGHEAFDCEQRSLGMYPTTPEAANAVFRAPSNEVAGNGAG